MKTISNLSNKGTRRGSIFSTTQNNRRIQWAGARQHTVK